MHPDPAFFGNTSSETRQPVERLAQAAVCISAGFAPDSPTAPAPRLLSIWEITQWILPMAPLLARYAAELPTTLLPNPLPEIAQIAAGTAAQFYDLDYRDIGRLIYAPQRDATEAAWRGVAALLAALWAEATPPQSLLAL